jgi:Ca-activated chloride channel family protein
MTGPLLVLAFVSLGAARLAAQESTPVFRVGLDVVNVTVTVRDSNGSLVSDLAAEEFVVREEGRVQDLALFAPAADPQEREELSLNLGMLFDTSNSMRDNLRLSKESAIRFLDSIPRAKDLILIFFDRDIRLSRYNSENQQGIFERILETEGEGFTALYDSIAVYISRVIGTPGRKVLLVFTDGEDTTSATSASDVIRLVRSTNVTVYPIAFNERRMSSNSEVRARAFLGALASSSGGQVFRPLASRELAETYNRILDELSAQYVLGFVSDDPRHDGTYRRLEVEVRRPGLRVRHRPGYYAPASLPEAGGETTPPPGR